MIHTPPVLRSSGRLRSRGERKELDSSESRMHVSISGHPKIPTEDSSTSNATSTVCGNRLSLPKEHDAQRGTEPGTGPTGTTLRKGRPQHLSEDEGEIANVMTTATKDEN